MGGHPSRKRRGIPRLHDHRPRSREFTNQPLTAADTGDDASARYPLHHIFAIPCHQMAVVNDIFLAFDQLQPTLALAYSCGSGARTHILSNDGAET